MLLLRCVSHLKTRSAIQIQSVKMAIINRFLCWNLRTSMLVGYGYVIITGVFSLVMRLIDLIATGTDFEISQGFQTPWRSHFWQAFLASDVVLTFDYVVMILFSAFMLLQVRERHFVMYMSAHRRYIVCFFIYQFVEICFSIFEFSYYGMNTFRLKYIVWTWLFWVFRTFVNGVFFVVLIARKQEMGEQMDMELRFAGERKRPGFGY